jgi:hypothetical protein
MRILIGREEIWDGNKNSLSLSKNTLNKLWVILASTRKRGTRLRERQKNKNVPL